MNSQNKVYFFMLCCLIVSMMAQSGELGNKDIDTASPKIILVTPSEKVIQLTGEYDRSCKIPTLSQSETTAGVVGTDLGSSFIHKGKLCFLFGDTWGRSGDADSMAFAELSEPDKLRLEFPLAEDGKFRPVTPPGVEHGAFCVPSYGISLGGKIYMAYTGEWDGKNMCKSILASSTDDGKTWETLYILSRATPGKEFDACFINVAFATDPENEQTLWMWGSGAYRKSDLYLARTNVKGIGDRANWQYYTGCTSDNNPIWKPAEKDARPLFHHPQIGEFSCAWIEPLGCWILLYNSGKPRGIILRAAPNPWGPWSEPLTIFDPWKHAGYGQFMHNIYSNSNKTGDQLHDPERENVWGGEYGPYLIPAFTESKDGCFDLYYTMSTWNPYQVVLMRCTVSIDKN